MPAKRRKPQPSERTVTARDYDAWKKAGRAILKEQHGIDAPTVRECDWRTWYIGGLPPDAAAEAAYRNTYNAQPPITGWRKR